MSDDRLRLTIVTPVYNDWESFSQLIGEIGQVMPEDEYRIRIVAVDDCSTTRPLAVAGGGSIDQVEVLRLTTNVGHQRAIAVGLVHIDQHDPGALVGVMDSDGEDAPGELRRLVGEARSHPGVAFVAQRKKRSETLGFKLFYRLYRQIFRMLTGRTINFGNFSVLPPEHVRILVHNANIWNNFAATLLQSKLSFRQIATIRGRRYAGQSSMNFVGLVTHGLGAMSVFSDAIFVRITLLSGLSLVLAVAAIVAVLAIRLFTGLAVPGWATTVIGFAILLSLQAIMMPVMLVFLQLSSRASFQSVPKSYAAQLIENAYLLYSSAYADAGDAGGDRPVHLEASMRS